MCSDQYAGKALPTRFLTLIAAIALVELYLVVPQVQAHKINVFAYVEGNRIMVEGYFGGGVKAQNCVVEVFSAQGTKIHEGRTNDKGEYSFALNDLPSAAEELKIVIEAGMGHKGEYILHASDLPHSTKKESGAEKTSPANLSGDKPADTRSTDSAQAGTSAALTTTMEATLDRKLEPIMQALGRQEKLLLEQKNSGPGMTEIVGGIGWIMGLFGIAAFFAARERSRKDGGKPD